MAYIGNTNTTQGFIPAIDYFNGDGATVAFTLSRPVASVAQVQAVIENVPQASNSAYTISGNTITFTSAPPLGTGNIYVYYTSPITQVIQPGQGTVYPSSLSSGGLVWDANGNVGVGITPSAWGGGYKALQVQGASLASSSLSDTKLTNNIYYDGTNWKLLSANASSYYAQGADTGFGAHTWYAGTPGTPGTTTSFSQVLKMRLGGVLCVGASTPSTTDWGFGGTGAVQMYTSTFYSRVGISGGTALADNAYASNDTLGQEAYIINGPATAYIQNSGTHNFLRAASGTAGNAISFASSMYINSSGNVGIGTSSPANKLDINNGNLRVTNSGTDIYYALENVASGGRNWTLTATATGSGEGAGRFLIKDTTSGLSRIAIDSNGNFLFNSGYGSAATAYGCRAWVNFNGIGTVAIRASGNVSSITDNGTGDYTVNFTNAMPDANYSGVGSCGDTGGRLFRGPDGSITQSTTQWGFRTTNGNGSTYADSTYVYVSIFR